MHQEDSEATLTAVVLIRVATILTLCQMYCSQM